MGNLKFLILALSWSLVLSCSSTKDVKDMYLVLKVDTTARYEQYAYVNQDGRTVVPYNRYLQCYTDTIRTIGFVFKPNVGCVAINNKGKELFNVFMANNGNDYPKDGLFRILDKGGTKMGVANMKGQVIVKPKYDAIFPYYEGLAAVAVGCKTVRPQTTQSTSMLLVVSGDLLISRETRLFLWSMIVLPTIVTLRMAKLSS